MEKGRSYVRITGSGLFFFLRNLLLLKIVLACAAFPAFPAPHTHMHSKTARRSLSHAWDI